MLKIVILSAIALSTAIAAGNQDSRTPIRRAGKLSSVTLLYISRAAGDTIRAAGADEALTFHWLMERSNNASGPFTIAPPKDFTIDGQKLSELSRERLGKKFESETVVEEVVDFKAKARLEAGFFFPKTVDQGALVVSTTFYGPTLSAKSIGEVVIDVGWGDKTELFRFGFEIPPR
jgi:hypothetical protein